MNNKKIFAILLSFLILSAPFFVFAAEWKGLVPKCGILVLQEVDGKEVSTIPNPCDFEYLMQMINTIINFLLFIIATPLAALILCYTGFLYITSQGDSGKVTTAKTILKNVIFGYLIALAAWLIVNSILSGLGFEGTWFLTRPHQ